MVADAYEFYPLQIDPLTCSGQVGATIPSPILKMLVYLPCYVDQAY
jgi:hypothetical protein